MGTITTGIGLISGINTAQLIDGLMAIEARGKNNLQARIALITNQRTALMDINARLLNLKTAAKSFRIDRIFQSALASSSNEETLTATAGNSFTVTPTKQLNKLNGLTAADAIAIQQHVAGTTVLTNPYRLIAADVNHTNAVTAQDATE